MIPCKDIVKIMAFLSDKDWLYLDETKQVFVTDDMMYGFNAAIELCLDYLEKLLEIYCKEEHQEMLSFLGSSNDTNFYKKD